MLKNSIKNTSPQAKDYNFETLLCLLSYICFILVPGGGIEPPRCRQRGILSPVRLPIPPSRLEV